jgi:hypothetical protein
VASNADVDIPDALAHGAPGFVAVPKTEATLSPLGCRFSFPADRARPQRMSSAQRPDTHALQVAARGVLQFGFGVILPASLMGKQSHAVTPGSRRSTASATGGMIRACSSMDCRSAGLTRCRGAESGANAGAGFKIGPAALTPPLPTSPSLFGKRFHRTGGAYWIPPLVHKRLTPRLIASLEPPPTLRS